MTPDLSRIPGFYHKYVTLVKETDLIAAFHNYQQNIVSMLKSIPSEKWDYKYAEDKWTTKELVQHIIDSERIFQYRALRFARMDKTELPGFDENLFAANAAADQRNAEDLINELSIVNRSSQALFQSFTQEQRQRSGVANKNEVYVEGIGFIILGHALHHINILKERYL